MADEDGTPAEGPDAAVPRDLDDLLIEGLERHAPRHVGLAAGAFADGRTAVSTTGRRDRSGAAPDGRTSFQIGSVTKLFTSLLLADAVCRGEVEIDQPLGSLIPGVATSRHRRPITLLDLATHTSGLPRLPPGLAWQALRHRSDPYAGFTTDRLVRSLSRTPKHPPGGRVRYSNYGAGVLGEALARAAGGNYGELVTERIAGPLGMSDTAIQAPRPDLVATGHTRRGRPTRDWQLPGLAGAGALRSTVDDLLTFLRAHLQPASSALAEPMAMALEPRVVAGRHLRVGLGWHVMDRSDGSSWWFHNGGTGGFFSFVAMEPRRHLAVAVLTNCARSVDRAGAELLLSLAGEAPPLRR